MAVYRIPPPARSGPASSSGSGSAERWLFGLAASYEEWRRDRYTFRLPPTGLPLFVAHREDMLVPSGYAAADVGVARRFAEVDDLGLICLLEVGDHPAVLWDVAEGRRNGLSIGAALDEPPGGGPEWIYLSEVSLTDRPADPLARVISSGALALRDWEVLTGEAVLATLGGVPAA